MYEILLRKHKITGSDHSMWPMRMIDVYTVFPYFVHNCKVQTQLLQGHTVKYIFCKYKVAATCTCTCNVLIPGVFNR